MRKIRAGVLGATGMVGQRFVQMLERHPWFSLTEVAASGRSAGRTYLDAVSGRRVADDSGHADGLIVKECRSGLDCDVVFSALDASVAGPIEEEFARAGYAVFSNSRNHRMDPDVPLLVPEVNALHADAVKLQKYGKDGKGFIVTNPNCSAAGLVIPLKALSDAYGLEKVMVTTMQALSGAGFAGANMDMQDNVIPFIAGEEAKVEAEPRKMLGTFDGKAFLDANITVSAQCSRVNVSDGHLESASVSLRDKPRIDEMMKTLRRFNPLKGLGLPSAPNPPIIVRVEEDRPQPKHDRDAGKGMAVTVGRIRECPILGYKFFLLSHNTIRGAAGGSILNAELLAKNGVI
jgi:aspartate-semialdehyde dehydrogenase